MVVIIMVIIGLALENNLWLYLALGMAVLAKLSLLANQAKAAQVQKDKGQELIENLFKSIQAKNN